MENPERIAASSGASQRSRMSSRPVISIPAASSSALPAVGGVVAEDHRSVERLAEDLVHQPQVHLAESRAAELGRRCAAHSPRRADLVLERADERDERVVAKVERLEREHLLAHELTHPHQLRLELRVRREVPRHGRPLLAQLYVASQGPSAGPWSLRTLGSTDRRYGQEEEARRGQGAYRRRRHDVRPLRHGRRGARRARGLPRLR